MASHDRAIAFRSLHQRNADSILVLPNAWDAMSARVFEDAGARAIATTSAGVSWALGRPDGEGLTRDEMVDAVRRIARVVQVPVSADVESGYGSGTAQDVAETVRRVIGAGAVGVNVEDTPGREGEVLIAVTEQTARIAAARTAGAAEGVEVFINARIDVFLAQVGPEGERVAETVRRARAYVAAGADGVFVPGVVDRPTIRRLAESVGAPLNVMAGPGAPDIAELRELGVSRVSLGPALARAVMARMRAMAAEVVQRGTYTALQDSMPYPQANGLFSRDSGAV